MPEIEPLEITLDDASLQRAVKASNASVDGLRGNVVKSNRDMESAWERQMRAMEKMSRGVESYGNAFERTLKGLAAGVRGATEFTAALLLGAKAIAAQTTATGALEAGWNRVRAARIGAAAVTEGIGGALVVGTEIAAVVAIEKIASATYARSKEIQSQALQAQRTGFTFEDRSALDFTAQRAGQSLDYYDSAVKSAGGVAQLAKELRELADVRDPLVRAELAFKEFGPDADRVLASLGDRFGDNADRAKSWGIALDEVSRSRIDGFRRDVDAIKGSFDSFTDSLAASKKQLGALFEVDLSSIWEMMTRGPGTLWNAVKPPIAFTADTLDTKGAQREIQRRSSENATDLNVLDTLRSLRPAAEKSFQKDFFAKDQEADLRAEIADLRKKLFVSDRTSPRFGQLVSGASFETGYGGLAESVQKLTSDQSQLSRVLEHKKELKDADEAARKAAQELEAAQRNVASGLESAQRAELSGADRLRFERDHAIAQYGKTKDLVRDINREFDIRFGIEGKAIIDQSGTDMRTRAAAEARSQEGQLGARTKYTSDAILNTIRVSAEAPAKRDAIEMQGADLQRESQLRQLESFDAKTLTQKAAVEAAKFQIESNYFTRARDLEAAGIDRGYQKQLQDLKVLADARLITEKAFNDQKSALDQNESLDLIRLHERTDAEIEKSGIGAARAVREEYQRGFQEIKGEASGLLNTLFTSPTQFPKQLAETIRAAILRPIIDALSDMIAGALHPVVFGGAQGGGIAATLKGLAGGRSQDPLRISSEALKGSTDVNTGATERNTDELRRLGEAIGRQGSSGGGSAVSTAGGFFGGGIPSFARTAALGMASFAGMGGLSLPNFAGTPALKPRITSTLGGSDMEGLSGRGGFEGIAGGVPYQSSPFADNPAGALGIGGTAGFAGGEGGSSFIPAALRSVLGGQGSQGGQGGIFQSGGFGKYLSGLKSNFWNENINTGAGSAVAASSQGFGGKLEGVLTSKGAASLMVAGGMPLAMAGLTGTRRGTWGGIAESAGGGALIGAGIGTMILPGIGTAIGAGIGAAAGFVAGGLEKLFGVESPENKAIRIIKETYRVDINRQMAQQIVQIADSKYGKNVNIAARSPEVRQMLELYAAGTGQGGRMPLSAATPYGAILSERGGQLFQDQSYRFGVGHVQPSSLPIAGGGNPSPYPVVNTIQLDGPATTALLQAQVVQVATPEFIQNGWSSAQRASNGRLQNAAMVNAPGLMFG